jgi:hypothetical protein
MYLTEDLVVYRGIKDLEHLNNSLFISTTFYITLASSFSGGNIVLIIK